MEEGTVATTACQVEQVELFSDSGKPLVLSFDGGEITSNAGAVLLRLLDEKYRIAERMASVWNDRRDKRYVKHELLDLIRQRLYQIACGYEDANDADTLRHDPAFLVSCGQTDREEPLASQPTLSRFENQADAKTLYRLSLFLVDLFVEIFEDEPPEEIILDVDATDATTHGGQQLTFFNAYYDEYMYHPLLIYEGNTGFPLVALLRPGNRHASYGAVAIVQRLIERIREHWPEVRIVLRADSAFAGPEMFDMLEREGVDYFIGLVRNRRLEREVTAALHELRKKPRGDENPRKFTSFWYAARSWSKRRRVLARVEITLEKDNPRFVVTNVRRGRAEECYQFYCGRAVGAEAPIKELKNTFSGDRLSCHRFSANQLRLLLSTFAFVLVWLLRRSLGSTEWVRRRLDTIRLRLIKIGASVRRCVRHIRFRLPTAFPDKGAFLRALQTARPPMGQLRSA